MMAEVAARETLGSRAAVGAQGERRKGLLGSQLHDEGSQRIVSSRRVGTHVKEPMHRLDEAERREPESSPGA